MKSDLTILGYSAFSSTSTSSVSINNWWSFWPFINPDTLISILFFFLPLGPLFHARAYLTSIFTSSDRNKTWYANPAATGGDISSVITTVPGFKSGSHRPTRSRTRSSTRWAPRKVYEGTASNNFAPPPRAALGPPRRVPSADLTPNNTPASKRFVDYS